MNENTSRIWGRFGITLLVTPEELDAIVKDSGPNGRLTLVRVFAEGRAELDGESYIPGPSFEDYNWENGTHYDREDVDLDTALLQDCPVRADVRLPDRENGPPHWKERGDTR